jgi:hypothetical protein
MKQKDMYTLNELCDNLDIPVSDFCKRANITEGTLTRIRRGYSARRSTINKMLKIFSQVYDRELSLDNVTGLYPLGSTAIDEKVIAPSASPNMPCETTTVASTQKRTSERKKADIPDDLPEGTVTHFEFAKRHGVNPRTFSDQIVKGIGRGQEKKDKINAVIIPKENRPGETDKYLTPSQQLAAIEYWQRHGTKFTE